MSKITLGQAIDAMMNGQEVLMGKLNYRIRRSAYDGHFFECRDNEDENSRWMRCAIDSQEISGSKIDCHIYHRPIKWEKTSWFEALKAASRGEKVAETTLGTAVILTYEDFFKRKTVEQLENWPYPFFVEIRDPE